MTHKDDAAVARAHDVALNPRTKGYECFDPPGVLLYQPQSLFSPKYSLFNARNRKEAARLLPTQFKMAVTDPD